jgi:hypothetical protein
MSEALKEVAKATSTTMNAMSSQPMAIALLLVNIGFLAFAGYVLGEVAENARERNKNQMDLIARLVHDVDVCNEPRSAK